MTGWFSEPRPCFDGALADGPDGPREAGATAALEAALGDAALQAKLGEEVGRVIGYLAVRLTVKPDGAVARVDALADTLVADPADVQGVIAEDDDGEPVYEDACADVRLALHQALSAARFPAADGPSSVTVPFSFS